MEHDHEALEALEGAVQARHLTEGVYLTVSNAYGQREHLRGENERLTEEVRGLKEHFHNVAAGISLAVEFLQEAQEYVCGRHGLCKINLARELLQNEEEFIFNTIDRPDTDDDANPADDNDEADDSGGEPSAEDAASE